MQEQIGTNIAKTKESAEQRPSPSILNAARPGEITVLLDSGSSERAEGICARVVACIAITGTTP